MGKKTPLVRDGSVRPYTGEVGLSHDQNFGKTDTIPIPQG
jgi:hypothetical protein